MSILRRKVKLPVIKKSPRMIGRRARNKKVHRRGKGQIGRIG